MSIVKKINGNIVFLVILMVIPVIMVLNMDTKSTVSARENRNLARLPDVFFTHEQFPRQVDSYIQDRIGFKNNLIALIREYPFLRPSVTEWDKQATAGTDDWLFLNNVTETIVDYLRLTRYSEKELTTLKNAFENVNEWCNTNGIKLIVLVSPLKHNIYPEYYNKRYIQLDKTSKYEQLVDVMAGSETTLIDARTLLINEKNNNQLYFKQDTHWNFHAGYIMAKELGTIMNKHKGNDAIKIPTESEIKITYSDTPRYGELLYIIDNSINVAKVEKEMNLEVSGSGDVKEISSVTFGDKRTYKIRESTLQDGLKLFWVHDSFSAFIEPYTSHRVKRVVSKFVWGISPLKYEEEILQEKPDFLIWQMHERYLNHIIDGSYLKDGGLTNQTVVEEKYN